MLGCLLSRASIAAIYKYIVKPNTVGFYRGQKCMWVQNKQSRKIKINEQRPYLLAVTQVQILGEEVSKQPVGPSPLPVTWLSCLSTCFLSQKQDTDFKRQSLPCVSSGQDNLRLCLEQPLRGLRKRYVEQSRVCVDVFWHCFFSLNRFTLPIKKDWSSINVSVFASVNIYFKVTWKYWRSPAALAGILLLQDCCWHFNQF